MIDRIAAVEAYWVRLGLDSHFGKDEVGQAAFATCPNRLLDTSGWERRQLT